jgi:putative permease
MLYYKYDVLEAISSCLPEKHRDVITYIGLEVNSSIGGYLRGQVLVSLIVAGMTTASLYWLEVPHPIFCGVFVGAASALPFIGVVIAILPAVFFAWFKYQTLAIILETVASFAVNIFSGRIYYQAAGLQKIHGSQPADDHRHGHGVG